VLFHRLDLQFEVSQVVFQLLDLLCLGQIPALEMVSPTAFTTAVTSTIALTGVVIAITGFMIGHFLSPYRIVRNIYFIAS
jgi:hypothetical protein